MTDFDLDQALRAIHRYAHQGQPQHVARLAAGFARTLANMVAERDAAVATITILRGAPTGFDLEAALTEIRCHTGGVPSVLGDVATRLAFRLFAAHGAGVVTVDALDSGLTDVETELRDVATNLVSDYEALEAAYIDTVVALQRQHISQPDTEVGVTCHPDCPACTVVATVPYNVVAAAAAFDPSGATA